jgi:hypothetical protein
MDRFLQEVTDEAHASGGSSRRAPALLSQEGAEGLRTPIREREFISQRTRSVVPGGVQGVQ